MNEQQSLNFSQALSHRYYRGALWSPSYFAASGAGVPLSDIRQYIEQQRKPVL
jgi:putative transposase